MGLGHEISECTRTDKRIHPGSFGSPTRIDNNDSFVILLRSWYNRIRSKARTLYEIAKTISNEGTMNSFESRCALFPILHERGPRLPRDADRDETDGVSRDIKPEMEIVRRHLLFSYIFPIVSFVIRISTLGCK